MTTITSSSVFWGNTKRASLIYVDINQYLNQLPTHLIMRIIIILVNASISFIAQLKSNNQNH